MMRMAVQTALGQPAFLRDFRERDRSISQRVVNRFQSFGIELADGALRYYHAVILPLSRAVRVVVYAASASPSKMLSCFDHAEPSPPLCALALPPFVDRQVHHGGGNGTGDQ